MIPYFFGLNIFRKPLIHFEPPACFLGFIFLSSEPFSGTTVFENNSIEWIMNWFTSGEDSIFKSHCNTISTPLGGTHENGFKSAILKGFKT